MKPEQYTHLNLREAVELLYPNHAEIFEYDTAKPQEAVNRIVDQYIKDVFVWMGVDYSTDETRAKIYKAVCTSVYAYGRNDARISGFIPLSLGCLQILQDVGHKWNTNLIFTPTLENLRPTQLQLEDIENWREFDRNERTNSKL